MMSPRWLGRGGFLALVFVTDFPEKTFSFRAINFPLTFLREENVFRCFCCLSVRNDYSQIYWDLPRRQRYLGSSKLAGIMMQAELVSLRSDLWSKISSVPVRIIYWDLEVAH